MNFESVTLNDNFFDAIGFPGKFETTSSDAGSELVRLGTTIKNNTDAIGRSYFFGLITS